jgi:hypothetical protein
MKPGTIVVVLAVALSLGICYLAIRHYKRVVVSRSEYLDLPNPCRPSWLYAARSNASLPDAVIREKLIGLWWRCEFAHYDGGKLRMPLTFVSVGRDGHYDCHKYGRTNAIQGHMHVTNGLIFDTITNYNFGRTNERVHYVFSNQVVRITERDLVYRSCPEGNGVVLFRKVKQVKR